MRIPLADRIRPENIDEVVGQAHLMEKVKYYMKLYRGEKFQT